MSTSFLHLLATRTLLCKKTLCTTEAVATIRGPEVAMHSYTIIATVCLDTRGPMIAVSGRLLQNLLVLGQLVKQFPGVPEQYPYHR